MRISKNFLDIQSKLDTDMHISIITEKTHKYIYIYLYTLYLIRDSRCDGLSYFFFHVPLRASWPIVAQIAFSVAYVIMLKPILILICDKMFVFSF